MDPVLQRTRGRKYPKPESAQAFFSLFFHFFSGPRFAADGCPGNRIEKTGVGESNSARIRRFDLVEISPFDEDIRTVLSPCMPMCSKAFDGQKRVVDRAQPVGGHDKDLATQPLDQVPDCKALPQGHQQAADPLNEQTLATTGHALNLPQDIRQADRTVVLPGCDQRGQRLRKEERGDLVERQVTILHRVEEFACRPGCRNRMVSWPARDSRLAAGEGGAVRSAGSCPRRCRYR